MLFEDEVKLLLKPGYMPMETGYYHLPNGQMYVAALTPMYGCKGKWIDWWFGSYLEDTKTFRQFAPEALCFKWEKMKNTGCYLGASTYLEAPMGDKIFKSIRKYVDPAKYFDTSKFEEAGIEAIVCGEESGLDGTPDGRVVHVVRHTDFGCDMRSRFWINDGTDEMAQVHLRNSIVMMLKVADYLKIWAKESVKSGNLVGVNCKFCRSNRVVRNGLRKNNQYWLCKDCGHSFIDNQALPRMKYPAYTIASAVHDYYDGYSVSQICNDIENNTRISPSTSSVYGWIKKLTERALNEELAYHPLVGDSWILYKTPLRLKNENFWLIYIIDTDTRFLLAAKLSHDMNNNDIQALMLVAREKAGKMPRAILTNFGEKNLPSVELACEPDTKRIRIVSITNKELNNKYVQLFPSMVQDRLKPRNETSINNGAHTILNGFVFHHNYISLRHASGGIPAEAAGIESPFRDWMSVLRTELAQSTATGQ